MDFDKIDEGHPDYKPGEEPFHFFYNREERIARAPHIAFQKSGFYEGKQIYAFFDCRVCRVSVDIQFFFRQECF